MFLKLLFIPVALFSTIYEIPEENLIINPNLGDVRVFHSHAGFHIHHEGTRYNLEAKNLDPVLRKAKTKDVKKLLQHYYISVSKNHSRFYLMPRVALSKL